MLLVELDDALDRLRGIDDQEARPRLIIALALRRDDMLNRPVGPLQRVNFCRIC
jgi:hypothetical protein